jgi:hypothetical protein
MLLKRKVEEALSVLNMRWKKRDLVSLRLTGRYPPILFRLINNRNRLILKVCSTLVQLLALHAARAKNIGETLLYPRMQPSITQGEWQICQLVLNPF